MNTKSLNSGDIFRTLMLVLAFASIILMPQPGQPPLWSGWSDIVITIIVPVIAPILFVLLLMDIVLCTATGSADTSGKKITLALEGLAGMFILLRWLDFLLTTG